MILFFSLKLTLLTSGNAKDLGVYGETFLIMEDNLLHAIEAKLQSMNESGELSKKQKELSLRTKEKLRHPLPLKDIVKTTIPRKWLYDPSLTVEEDIRYHKGKIIVSRGTVVNPLDTLSWGAPLLFLDGDDPEQVRWAEAEHPLAKWVLVKGAPLDLEEKKKRPIYFDQAGILTNKFGIKQVPCRISQQDKKLLVEEVTVSEKQPTDQGKKK